MEELERNGGGGRVMKGEGKVKSGGGAQTINNSCGIFKFSYMVLNELSLVIFSDAGCADRS